MEKMQLLKAINPANSDVGKYSPSLYRWIRKNTWAGRPCEVFSFQRSDWDGSFQPYDKGDMNTLQTFIGSIEYRTGNRLSAILLGDRGYLENWAFTNKHAEHGMLDLTDWFWSQYISIGRAMFGCGPFVGDEKRWTYVGNTRRCNWSGVWYQADIQKRVRVERRKVWTPITSDTLNATGKAVA